MPSSTFFTVNPHWQWLIIAYFFFGGIAAGSYVIATIIDLVGASEDEPLARLGYVTAFVALLPCPVLLIVDLNRPERFWHMLIQSETGWPMLKYWSPMSIGSWALLIFGAFATLSLVGVLVRSDIVRWAPARMLDRALHRGRLRGLFALGGSVFGFFVASYTGVLLSVTNRPIWADTSFLGLLFLTSAASTAAALLLLLGRRWQGISRASLQRLDRLDAWIILLELAVLVMMLVSLGAVIQVWFSTWGILIAVVVLLGMLAPLALRWRPRLLGGMSLPTAAVLTLAGGFFLRAIVIMASEGI